MKSFDQYPKSVKKFIRYIKQNATKDELIELKQLLLGAIELRYKKIG